MQIMKKTFYEKLEAVLQSLDPPMTFNKLHFLAQMSTAHFSLWKSGKRSPSDSELEKLSKVEALGLSLDTLRGWRAADEYSPEALQEGLKVSGLEYTGTMTHSRQIAIKGYVAAGGLCEAEEEDLGTFEWFNPTDMGADVFGLRVRGDSMFPPAPDGSLLVVKPCTEFTKKKWYVVQTKDGEATFKIVQAEGNGRIKLIPLNPEYKEISIPVAKVQRMWEVLNVQITPG